MSVLHVITGLNVGGAEAMLAKLIEHDRGDAMLRPRVLSLLPPGRVAPRIAACGIEIETLGMTQGKASLAALSRLRARVRATPPTLLQGWMHHGNLAASLAARLAPRMSGGKRPPVIWNIRHSLVDIGHEKPLSQAVLRLGRMLSGGPDAIIYNSEVAARQYEAFGFSPERAIVIPNGFDCQRFAPRPGASAMLRLRFGIAPDPVIVAMVARQHPMKDTANLVEAVRRARAQGHDLHLLLAGTGTDAPDPGLAAALARAVPPQRLTLAGERADVAEWLCGVDILALPSAWGEAFPNILGEAMASGVPCVATDVGDSAAIIGGHGRVVAPRDPAALAQAIGALAGLDRPARRAIGAAARERIVRHYGIERIVGSYAALYESVLEARGMRPRRDRPRAQPARAGAAAA